MNIKEVTDNELLDELCRRYDNCVFQGIKLLGGPGGKYIQHGRTKGSHLACMGLGSLATDEAKALYYRTQR